MKISIELDLTPKEARKMMGLPDLEAMQEKIVDLIYNELKTSIEDVTDPKELWSRFMPFEQSMETLQKIMPAFNKLGSSSEEDADEKEKK